MSGNYILTESCLTVYFNGKTGTFYKEDELRFDEVLEYLRANKYQEIFDKYIVNGSYLKKYSKGHFELVGNTVVVDGKTVGAFLSETILNYSRLDLDYKRLIKFVQRCDLNPHAESVEGLFKFLATGNYPITEKGTFIAYKVVRPDPSNPDKYVDIYTGKIDNSVGQTVTMPRSEVAFDPNATCSFGLHVGAMEYVTRYYGRHGNGDVIVNLEVCPSDVVSVPVDHSNQKMRVCKYVIIGKNEEATELLPATYSTEGYTEESYIKFSIKAKTDRDVYIPTDLFNEDEEVTTVKEVLEGYSDEDILYLISEYIEDDSIRSFEVDDSKLYDEDGFFYGDFSDDEEDEEDDYWDEGGDESFDEDDEEEVEVAEAVDSVPTTRDNWLDKFKFWK